MGVNLLDLVREYRKVITLENLRDKTLAIDAMNWLYQFLAIIRERDGSPLRDYEGNVTSHLMGLFHRNLNFLEMDIKPVYVFDGKPPERKSETIKERQAVKREARKQMERAREAGDLEEARKYASATSKLTGDMVSEAKALLRAFGIPVVQAPSEGEAQASHMVARGDIWATASQDYDSFLFGSQRLVRNLNVRRSRKVGNTTVPVDIEWYSLRTILRELDLTRDQLIDVGILIGTDFHDGVKGVGPKTALKLVRKHGDVDTMLARDIAVRKKPLAASLPAADYHEIRDIFLDPPVTDDYAGQLKWTKPDYAAIATLLVERHNFDPQRVETNLKKLRKKLSSGRQTSLDSFLAG